jgi:hypothetical protein
MKLAMHIKVVDNAGVQAFKNFQRQLDLLSRREPAQQGLCALLNLLVGGYNETFDEAPLPVAVADRAYGACSTWSEAST